MSTNSISGVGTISMWGLTPAIDLLQFTGINTKSNIDEKYCNILLVGNCDARHILKTVATRYLETKDCDTEPPANNKVHLNFYVVENRLELYVRQMLLLAVAFEESKNIGIHEKCVQFMELYGNVLLRPQTKKTLVLLANQFIKMITDEDFMDEKFPFLNIREMKFREKDEMVDILKYWTEFCDPKKTDMNEKWDKRLRHFLGTRYDNRLNIFDWDYHMKLMEKDEKAAIISAEEYKAWRNSGIAFKEFESAYTQPNVTLNTGIIASGHRTYNYSADTVTGPFISYGIRSEDASLFEKVNEKHKKQSYDVTYKNLQGIFEAVRPQSKNETEHNLSQNATVHFVPLNACNSLCKKASYLQYFDLVYISANAAQNLTSDLIQLFHSKTRILVEKPRYCMEFRKEHEQAFYDKLLELAKACGVVTCEFPETMDEDISSNYYQFSCKRPADNDTN